MQADNEYTRVENVAGVARCLEALMQHRGASLLLDEADAVPLPVLLVSAELEKGLLIDISTIREVATKLKAGTAFRLLGQSAGKLERSGKLTIRRCYEEAGCYFCQVDYPVSFEVLVRRNSFRAALRQGMVCEVLLDGGEGHGKWDGRLSNLSLSGCLVDLSLGAASMLASVEELYELTLNFPN